MGVLELEDNDEFNNDEGLVNNIQNEVTRGSANF
jgi:hypothetical protein